MLQRTFRKGFCGRQTFPKEPEEQQQKTQDNKELVIATYSSSILPLRRPFQGNLILMVNMEISGYYRVTARANT